MSSAVFGAIIIALIALVIGIYLVIGGFVGSEFFPQQDDGQLQISILMPPGTNLAATDQAARRAEQLKQDIEKHEAYAAQALEKNDEDLAMEIAGKIAEFQGELTKAIDGLPEREKLVMSLYYERELNLKEIGGLIEHRRDSRHAACAARAEGQGQRGGNSQRGTCVVIHGDASDERLSHRGAARHRSRGGSRASEGIRYRYGVHSGSKIVDGLDRSPIRPCIHIRRAAAA